jgi:hypothetical protein
MPTYIVGLLLGVVVVACGPTPPPMLHDPKNQTLIACPSGMNEDSSGTSGRQCGAGGNVSVQKEEGGVTVTCSNNASVFVKCTLPPQCMNGFEIQSDPNNAAGRLKCNGSPSPPAPRVACPSGMNEENSSTSGRQCGPGENFSIKRESSGVTVACSDNAGVFVKCTLPPQCTNGFEILPDPNNAVGRLKCEGPPPPPPPPQDPCVKHRIRSQGAYNGCLTQCDADYDNNIGKCQDDPCRGGTDNARKGCKASCSGSMQASRRDGCCPDCR